MTYQELEQMEAFCAQMRKELERHQPEQLDEWLTYQQMLQEYDFPGIKSVQRANWREKHNFYPCKTDGKGCQLRINRRLLENWLMGERTIKGIKKAA